MDQFQGHEHRHNIRSAWHVVAGGTNHVPTEDLTTSNTYDIIAKRGCDTPRYGDETRSKNLSIKIWQRIS